MMIRVFDETFEIEGIVDPTFFSSYVCKSDHAHRIDISDNDIFNEKIIMEGYLLSHGQDINNLTGILLYRLAVLRKISEYAPNRSAFLFHGSAISYEDNGILFCAKSGVGKSTHAGLWKECFCDSVTYINDDKPFVKQNGDDILVYGSPWDGKHHLNNNISKKLKAVCAIQRNVCNSVEKMSQDEALTAVCQWIYHPKGKASMIKTLEFADYMARTIPFYTVRCNMSPDAAITCYEGIKESLNETE